MWRDQIDLFRAFDACGAEYLIVGGHAVSEHSEPRATKDLEIFVGNDRQNAERVFKALAVFGASLEVLSPADFCTDGQACFQIGVEPMRVDVLQSIDGVSFEQAWSHRVRSSFTSEGIPVDFISRDDLILNKLASGRLRDLADGEALRAAKLQGTDASKKSVEGL